MKRKKMKIKMRKMKESGNEEFMETTAREKQFAYYT